MLHDFKPNHLINEKSPYLLQHAYNPVDWYPWGDEALNRAEKEDKPILLSIGYSTCHWCHVMEKESFSDPKTAEIMNQSFVCIKVDREERPDIDMIYMTAVSAMTGSGGWPLNVFLTPDLKPFFGGTYFPPDPKPGLHSWPDLLSFISATWQDPVRREKLISSADELTGMLEKHLSKSSKEVLKGASFDPGLLDEAVDYFASIYDAARGGFSRAPKFPSPAIQNFLLSYHAYEKIMKKGSEQGDRALDMAGNTLRAMAKGGIYDHLGGGFHRYSTDNKWHIPHFEKMLYDNAQLVVNYLVAFQITRDRFFATVAEETLAYILRDMTHPDGGFYSAEDADSVPLTLDQSFEKKENKKVEGAFYVWDFKEIEDTLGENMSDIFAYRYGIKLEGNAEYDPHGDFKRKNILLIAHSLDETARKFSKPVEEVEQILEDAKTKLFNARAKRPRPHLDDKIIVSWNGLMISAMARAYQILGREEYLMAAQNAAEFIHDRLYDQKEKKIYRRWREGERKISGMASDYAFLIQALIDLYEADFNPKWLDWALELSDEQIKLFYDSINGGFFMTRKGHDRNLLFRIKEDYDSVIPSAGSVAASNFWRLVQFTDRRDFLEIFEKTLQCFLPAIKRNPGAVSQMLVAFGFACIKPLQVIIAGDKDAKNTILMLQRIRSVYIPGETVILIDGVEAGKRLSAYLPFIAAMKEVNGMPTAYACIAHACREPVTDPDVLSKILELNGSSH